VILPIIFAIHNLEEWLTIDRFLPLVRRRAPDWAAPLLEGVHQEGFRDALLIVTIVGVVIGLWALLRPHSQAALWTLLLLLAVLLLNVASHLGSAVFLRGYSPGVASAVLLNLPFSVYVFRGALREGWLSRAGFLALVPAALVVHGPLLIAFLFVTSRGA